MSFVSQNQVCLSGNRSTSLNAPGNGDRVVPGFQELVLFLLNQVANRQPVLNLSTILRPLSPQVVSYTSKEGFGIYLHSQLPRHHGRS